MKVTFTQTSALLAVLAAQTSAYNCWQNTNDAGRWNDALSPADRLLELCKLGDGEHCHQAIKGKMCVSGPRSEAFCNFVWGWAGSQQSWHGDWFLWSDISCDGGVDGTADDLTIRIL